jgi:glycosyltransferase involved in cell wall biosynthesis
MNSSPTNQPSVRLAVIPAYQAAATLGPIVSGLRPYFDEVWVVDDGSTDQTAHCAKLHGASVIVHKTNQGKAAALLTALRQAKLRGIDTMVTLDADGQHPPEEAIHLDQACQDRNALVLGVRDLVGAGAPGSNLYGNSVSNYWLSLLTGRPLSDTQCGLRRYPVLQTLALGAHGTRFAWESEVVLRALLTDVRVEEVPVKVLYPSWRTSHFHHVRDPAQIVVRVVLTLIEHLIKNSRIVKKRRGKTVVLYNVQNGTVLTGIVLRR